MWVLGIHTQFLVLVQQALLSSESSPQPPVHFSCISMKSDHTIMSLPSGDVSLCHPVWVCVSRTHIKGEDIVSHSGVMQHTHLLTPYMGTTVDQSTDTTKVQLGEPMTSVVTYRNMDAWLLMGAEVTHRQLHYQGPPQQGWQLTKAGKLRAHCTACRQLHRLESVLSKWLWSKPRIGS